MTNDSTLEHAGYTKTIWFRAFVFLIFLLSVSLLAGYIAIKLRYPSLYNVTASFSEYAIPLPFNWGMLHIPSMIIYGIPLLVLPVLQDKYTQYFRVFCICSFLLLLLELDNKVPFLLFPKVDALAALIFSLVVVPLSSKNNPALVAAFKLLTFLAILILGFFAYSFWKHQIPTITTTQYEGGVFELKSIDIKTDFHKEMVFNIDLKERVAEDQVCTRAQPMANSVLQDYPFDSSYKKVIKVTFNPTFSESQDDPYEMGEISLNDAHKEKDGRFACYVKYR